MNKREHAEAVKEGMAGFVVWLLMWLAGLGIAALIVWAIVKQCSAYVNG